MNDDLLRFKIWKLLINNCNFNNVYNLIPDAQAVYDYVKGIAKDQTKE